MAHDFTLFGIYVPMLLIFFFASIVLCRMLDQLITWFGGYRLVWHPQLFRVSLFVCIFGGLGLLVYR
jgi:protein AaeX